MSMPLNRRQQLEAQGFIVTERYDAGKRFTFTYVRSPTGLEYKWFGTLADVSHITADDGESIYLDINAWPIDECPPPEAGLAWQDWYFSENDAWSVSMKNEQGNMELISLALCIAIIAIAGTILLLAICIYIQTSNAPCGETQITKVNDCWKIIRAPDCQYHEFNACGGPDNNGDGKPDGEMVGTWQKDVQNPFDITEIIKWVAIGAVAIGAIYLAVTFIKPKPRYYTPEPPPVKETKK